MSPAGASREPGPARTADPGIISRLLVQWFAGRRREVPWRHEDDPYRIWVAEVMAQQTRVETVKEYWEAFLDRFPDVATLAEADLDEVLKEWEGLGYYARARHLHEAARLVRERHGGQLPSAPARLRELPGVGPYTAGAVASLAFGVPEPAVDGNARRVLSRIFDLARPTPGRLRERARRLLESESHRAAELNQALMDLGGAVCTPGDPSCQRCPVARHCLALARGTVEERPPARNRPGVPHHDVGVAVLWSQARVLVQRRPEDGLLGGLWEFPGGKLEAGESPEAAIRRELLEELDVRVRVGPPLCRVEHAYSHLRVTLHVRHARHDGSTPKARFATEWRWLPPDDLGELPFPVANQRIIDALSEMEEPPIF